MLALGVTNAWGDVTCDFTVKSASHSTYTDSWNYGNFTVFGGANNNGSWAYVKMGGKSTNLANANPVYIASPQMTSAVSKVEVSIIAGSLPKSGMSVNSWGVYVYSDANMTQQVDYVAGGTIAKTAATFEFVPTTGTVWSANYYYKVSFDLANTSTTNGIIWLDKITFVESEGEGGETPNPGTEYTITTAVNDEKMGSVSGAGKYAEGKTVTLTATAKPGYKFVNWSNGETANPLKLTVTENVEITANFEAIPPMTCAEASAAAKDEVVVLNPFDVVYVVKDAGYIYIKDESGVNLIYDFNLDDKLKAGDHVEGFVGVSSPYNGLPEIKPSVTFEDLTVTPGTTTAPTVMVTAPTAADVNKYIKLEKVTFSSDATFATSSATNATMVVNGTNVTLRNQFKLSKSFVKNGVYDITGFAAVYNSTVQIYYLSATKLSLTISATANGGTVTGTGEFMEGDEVTLTATANEGYEFVGWTWGNDTVCKTAEYKVTVEEDMNLIANFKKIEYTVAATASEGGTVTGLAEEGKYEHGATATLTATANEGYEFVNWTSGEAEVSTDATYTFTVTENVTLVANFKEAVPANPGTALDNIETSATPVKVIENGQMIIIKNGVKYNAQGAILK